MTLTGWQNKNIQSKNNEKIKIKFAGKKIVLMAIASEVIVSVEKITNENKNKYDQYRSSQTLSKHKTLNTQLGETSGQEHRYQHVSHLFCCLLQYYHHF